MRNQNLTGRKLASLVVVGLLILIGTVVTAPVAHAAVSISRAELSGTRLRIEGQATPNRTITVDGVAMGTSDGAGKFRIERDPFAKPADCTVDVNDGSASPTPARLSGCTVSTTPTPGGSGSISLTRGGNGHGRITSQPPGIDCTITDNGGIGSCNNVFFPAGTEVRLEAVPAADSAFLGWEFEGTCPDAPRVIIQAGIAHICRPGFVLR